MTLPISVFIITKNEEARLEKTIGAIRDWVHEVVVVDSGSTDKSVEIAKSLGAKVTHHDWAGFGRQKRFAEDQCSQDWWLNIDADEIITPELSAEIHALFQNGEPTPAVYNLPIHLVYPGDIKPRPLADDYNVVRLYHRTCGRYRDHPVYDRVVLEEGVETRQLKNPAHHFAVLNWTNMLDKMNANSGRDLEKLKKRPRWLLKLRIFFGFPLNFLRNYIFRRHIFGGVKGFIFALNSAYTRTMRIAKALEEKE